MPIENQVAAISQNQGVTAAITPFSGIVRTTVMNTFPLVSTAVKSPAV
jgi:hypothetical protein